jgi:hypothetical protein
LSDMRTSEYGSGPNTKPKNSVYSRVHSDNLGK